MNFKLFETEKVQITEASSFGSILLGSRKETWSAITDPSSSSSIDRVFWCAGHLSISFNDGQDLITFDAVPEDLQGSQQITDLCLDVKGSTKKLLNLWHNQSRNIILLYEDGELTCFNFDPKSFTWNVVGSIIVTATRGASVQTACLHSGAIYWTETTAQKNEFHLCYRTLPQDGDDWNLLGFSRQTTLLKKCPTSNLYSSSKGLLIWPRWTKGPAIFLLWNSADTLLQVVTPIVGVAYSEVVTGPAMDFTKLVLKTMASWHEVSPIGSWVAVKQQQTSNDRQYFLTHDGSLICVSDAIDHVVDLEELENDFLDCMVVRGFVIAVYSSCARAWSLVTGKLVQVIYVSELLLGCWLGGATVSVSGLYWAKGIYRLKLLNQGDRVNLKGIQEKSPQERSCRERTTKRNPEKKRPRRTDDSKLEMRSPEISEMSASLNSFLEETVNLKDGEGKLNKLLEIHKSLAPPLKQDLDPLINKFQLLLLNNMDSADIKFQHEENPLDSLVSTLLNTECPLSTSFICSCLTTVARDHPMQLIQGIDEHLGKNQEDDLTNEQKTMWDFLLNISKPPLEIFKTICRLKYLKTPNELKAFVDTALHIKERHFELFIYDNPSYIFSQIGKCLPPPSQSLDYTGAAVVLMQLLVKSGDRATLKETLSLIGAEKNWQLAISICDEMSKEATMGNHQHLYYALLAALEQADILSQYQDKVLSMAPKNLGMSSILDIIEKFARKSSTNKLFSSEQILTVKNLLDFIQQNNSI